MMLAVEFLKQQTNIIQLHQHKQQQGNGKKEERMGVKGMVFECVFFFFFFFLCVCMNVKRGISKKKVVTYFYF